MKEKKYTNLVNLTLISPNKENFHQLMIEIEIFKLIIINHNINLNKMIFRCFKIKIKINIIIEIINNNIKIQIKI
jgi:hypothetical protein